jgi:putative transposase
MRFRLYPTPAQDLLLREQCAHARYVWNLGLEQRLMWARWKGPTPGYVEQCRQLTEARAAQPWLAQGSQTVKPQALRDLDQAWRNFFAGTHHRRGWRKRGGSEGLRVVGPQALRVCRDNGRWSAALVPKVGWVPFRRTRAFVGWKSYESPATAPGAGTWRSPWCRNRSLDQAPGRSSGWIAGRPSRRPSAGMTRSARGTAAQPGRNVRAKAGLNRGILASGWGALVARLEQKAPGRVEKVNPAYTSQTCNACQHIARESRKNQGDFACVACGHRDNADVNAARNIADRSTAAGLAVAARGDRVRLARSAKREPQLVASEVAV